MLWYYAENGQQRGPVEESALNELVASGVVRENTQVWHEGMAGWQPYATVRGPIPTGAPTSLTAEETRPCAECGRVFAAKDLVAIGPALVCAACKPIYLQRMREGGASGTAGVRYAGFWIRFVAKLIDYVLLGVVGLIIRLPLGVAMFSPLSRRGDPASMVPAITGLVALAGILSTAVAIAYEAYFLSTRGATPGKMVFGLKVVRPDGSLISVGRAVGRYFASILSSIILLIGYIMAAFDEQKRALHDRICDTRVIHAKQ